MLLSQLLTTLLLEHRLALLQLIEVVVIAPPQVVQILDLESIAMSRTFLVLLILMFLKVFLMVMSLMLLGLLEMGKQEL